MSFAYAVDEFLYWGMMNEKQPANKSLADGPFTTWNPRTWPGHNGAGHLFYPGENGPVTSLRMENWLGGMGDFEYLTLAKRRVDELKAVEERIRPKIWKMRLVLTPRRVMSSFEGLWITHGTHRRQEQHAARLLGQFLILATTDNQQCGFGTGV